MQQRETLIATSLCLSCGAHGGIICLPWAWVALSIWPVICSTQSLCFVLALLNARVFQASLIWLTCSHCLSLYLHGFTNWPLRASLQGIQPFHKLADPEDISLRESLHDSKMCVSAKLPSILSPTAKLRYNWVLLDHYSSLQVSPWLVQGQHFSRRPQL